MLATNKQIKLLQDLADRAEVIRTRHPSLIPCGLYHAKWDSSMTSEKASLRIQFYRSILDQADSVLHPEVGATTTEDVKLGN